jgi:Family of unknown function (DUF5996)
MPTTWTALGPWEAWQATCDTLHAHSQLLGKLAVALAPPEPELQHAALRLSARGWETAPLPLPDKRGVFVVALDLHAHEVVVEPPDGHVVRIPLTPDLPVGAVTRDVLAAVRGFCGPFEVHLAPQEVPWTVALDEDDEHRTYDRQAAVRYFEAATQASLVLAALRAPYRGRSTPLNAWWGSFDLAISLYSGRPADTGATDFIMRNAGDAEQVEIGWWPGDGRYPRAAFYAYAAPAPERFAQATLPGAGRWDPAMGEYLLDWDDVVGASDPFAAGLEFGRAAIEQACVLCEWDPALTQSALGGVPPVR